MRGSPLRPPSACPDADSATLCLRLAAELDITTSTEHGAISARRRPHGLPGHRPAPDSRGVHSTRGLPRMVRKDTRSRADSPNKPPRRAHPPGTRETLRETGYRGKPGRCTIGRPRPPHSRDWSQSPGPGPRARQVGSSRPGPSQVKSLPAVANLTASVAPAVLRAVFDSGTTLEPAVAKALRPHPEVRQDRSPPGAAINGLALPLVGMDRAPSLIASGGSALDCHLARFPRTGRDL